MRGFLVFFGEGSVKLQKGTGTLGILSKLSNKKRSSGLSSTHYSLYIYCTFSASLIQISPDSKLYHKKGEQKHSLTSKHLKMEFGAMLFSTNFSHIMAGCSIGVGKRSTRRKPPTCRKSLSYGF